MFTVVYDYQFVVPTDDLNSDGCVTASGSRTRTFNTLIDAESFVSNNPELNPWIDSELCEDNSTDDPYDLEIITDESSMV
jgi:hypothetical protein